MGARKVLVTGCSSGIGLALAVRLAKDELRRFKGKKTVVASAPLEARGERFTLMCTLTNDHKSVMLCNKCYCKCYC